MEKYWKNTKKYIEKHWRNTREILEKYAGLEKKLVYTKKEENYSDIKN